MLTRRHYIEIAKIIANAQRQNTTEQALDHVAEDLADMFKRDNSRFDRVKFIDACNPEVGY